jgi:hypothetical protein
MKITLYPILQTDALPPQQRGEAMIFYTVRYRVSYANGENSAIRFAEMMADTPEEASDKVTRLEFQRTDEQPIRRVNIRAVQIADSAARRSPKEPIKGERD